jgi:hypothetical protein
MILPSFLLSSSMIPFYLWLLCLSSSSPSTVHAAAATGDYEPKQCVRRMHQMPHLDSHLHTVDNTFAISADSTKTEYLRSLVIFPTILGAIGVLVLLGYLIGLMFRCCCQCCWGPQTSGPGGGGGKRNPDGTVPVNHDKRNLTIVFMSVIVIILGFDFGILGGNKSLNTGITRAIDAIDFVGDTFQSESFRPSLTLALSLSLLSLTTALTRPSSSLL